MKNDTQYFNVITNGLGYLNDARIVTPKKGDPYLCVRAALLEGSSDAIRYVYIDSTVRGEDAIALVTAHMDAICNKENKVLAALEFGSLNPTPFIFERGAKQGQAGVALKASLLRIRLLKINGQVVYAEPRDDQDTDQSSSETPSGVNAEQDGNGNDQIKDQPSSATPSGDDAEQGGNVGEAAKPQKLVELDESAANFAAQKEALESVGYLWVPELTACVYQDQQAA